MTSLDDLLPEPDEAVRCADFARVNAVNPVGTAIAADRVMVIEASLPWPKPVFEHPTMREIKNLVNASPVPTRLLARVPDPDTALSSETEITVFDRSAVGARLRRYRVSSPDELLDVGAALARGEEADCTGYLQEDRGLLGGSGAEFLLVCTQGSHDVCCGSDGARFAAAAENTFPDLTVYRVSHTGGHRFAPTAMTFPDGRMWAYLDAAALTTLVTGSGPSVVDRCRGWWGADPGFAQTAEAAVAALEGPRFDATDRTSVVDRSDDGMSATVTVTSTAHAGAARLSKPNEPTETPTVWAVAVSVARVVPTIACRQPGGLPAKSGHEFQVDTITSLG